MHNKHAKKKERQGPGSEDRREKREATCENEDVCVQMRPAVWQGVNADEL